jgi:hypothetical protein
MPSDVYIVSVYHQLHCLVSLRESLLVQSLVVSSIHLKVIRQAHLMTTYGISVTEGRAPKDLHHVLPIALTIYGRVFFAPAIPQLKDKLSTELVGAQATNAKTSRLFRSG